MENNELYVSFNQDNSCISLGNRKGYSIYQSCPIEITGKKNYKNGIKIIKMLNRTNILFLVEYSTPNQVIIYDDYKEKRLKLLKFNSNVLNIKVKKEKLLISILEKIYIYNFQNYKNIDIIETYKTEKGIFDMNKDTKKTIISYPDKVRGRIRIKCYESNTITLIHAHKNSISFISLNYNGSLVATASEIGTLIRIFNTENGSLLQEIRRGLDKAIIFDITFSNDNLLLSVSSNKKTIHVYSIENSFKEINQNDSIKNIPSNNKSILSILPDFFFEGYFQSEWSFTKINLGYENCLLGFVDDNCLIGVNPQGKYFRINLDLSKKGEYKVIENKQILIN